MIRSLQAIFVAGILLAAMPAPAFDRQFDAAYRLWLRNQHKEALAAFKALADSGNDDATYRMADMIRLGQGTPRDVPRALSIWEGLMQKGHRPSAVILAQTLFEADARDIERGLAVLARCVEWAHYPCLYIEGKIRGAGWHVPKDAVAAAALHERALALSAEKAAAGDFDAAVFRAGLAEDDDLGAHDPDVLMRQLIAAADAGDFFAMQYVIDWIKPRDGRSAEDASLPPRTRYGLRHSLPRSWEQHTFWSFVMISYSGRIPLYDGHRMTHGLDRREVKKVESRADAWKPKPLR